MNDMTAVSSEDGGGGDARLSKAELVYRTLRNEIVTLALAPGAPIDKTAWCERLGVSRFPVSDALARLAREGLATVEPQRGSFVSLLDHQDIVAAAFMRRALESEAAAALAPAVTDDMLGVLDESFRTQTRLAAGGRAGAFHEEDVRFHTLILDAIGMPRITEAVALAAAHLDRARRITLPKEGRLDAVLREHAEVIVALRARDADAAARAMRFHLAQMLDAVERLVSEEPGLFKPE